MIIQNMQLTLFQWVNIALILTLVILFFRYLIILYIEKGLHPAIWVQMKKDRKLSRDLVSLERKYPDKARFHTWFLQVERLKREGISGAFAELGVYKGESAAILHKMDPTRTLHLFDTFSGFTQQDLKFETGEAATYTTSHFADTTIKEVTDRIGPDADIRIYQGFFPETASGFLEPLALINLDADLYLPTIAALKLFYPLTVPGGVILVHDHHEKWPGIIRAVSEFCKTIPETPVFIPDNFGTVAIVKNQ
jgi:O-methyltransferase